jgi:PAS domain S-box-containing protein
MSNDDPESGAAAPSVAAVEALARTTAMASIVIDGDGIVRSWSAGGEALLGFSSSDALGRRLSDLIVPPWFRSAHEAGLERLRTTGESERLGGTFSMVALHRDGTTRVLDLTLTVLDIGDVHWYLGVLRDPAQSVDRAPSVPTADVLEVLFERAPEIITVLDDAGRQRTVNRAGAEMLGYGDDGRFPGDGRSYIHPDDEIPGEALLAAPVGATDFATGPFRYRVVARDGTMRWLETLLSDLRDVDAIRGVVAFSRDVTEDEERRAELATSVARLAAAVEALPAAAIENADRRIVHHNARFSVMVGDDPDADLRGFDIQPLLRRLARRSLDPPAVERDIARCARSVEGAKSGPIAYADATVLELETVVVVEGAAVTGRMWTIRDVTARVRAEQQLRDLLASEQVARQLAEERNDLLDELAEARMRFVSTVSHELRTPLASIVSAVDHLIDVGDVSSDTLGEYLRLVSRNADRLARLVEDLLVVGRLDAGQIHLVTVPLDVSAVLRDVVADFAPQMATRSISVVLDLQPGPALVADDLRVRQVAENLIGNAVKFGPDGGRITVACRVDGGDWLIEVADEGPGLPDDQRDWVFEPFARLPDTDDRVPGTGLGLAVVKGLVELHGGTVAFVDSDIGTRVHCRFPIRAPG